MSRYTLHVGDCREVMATMEPESVDSIVTDPPYGLSFMGKAWDHGVPGVEFWEAAMLEGFRFAGIDLNPEYQEIARARIAHAADLLPQGTPISRGFLESPTLDELAQAQNVKPIADASALFCTWPGEDDDGFESEVDRLRHSVVRKGSHL